MSFNVKRFLCFKLETGGIVIASIQMCSGILLIGLILFWIGLSIYVISMTTRDYYVFTVVAGVLAAIMLITLGWIFICYKTIKAIQKRNHSKLTPMLVILRISHVLLLLSCLHMVRDRYNHPVHPDYYYYSVAYGMFVSFSLIWNVYIYIVYTSLYKLFKEETKSDDKFQLITDAETPTFFV